MRKELIGIILCFLLTSAVFQVTGESLENKLIIEAQKIDTNSKGFFDVGVGIPTNVLFGQTRYFGADSLVVSVSNYGDSSAMVDVNFLLERFDNDDWAEVDSGGKGPYDLDPDIWVESFFDVTYDFEGEYRATFSLDSPRYKSDWTDDNPDNDVYQVVFFVIDPTSTPEWYVDDDGSPYGDGSIEDPFQTISEAIDSASPGHKIYVLEGTYNEQLIINKENLDISTIYKSTFNTDNKAVLDYSGGSVVIINAPFTRLSGFVIQNCGTGEEDAAVDITSDYNFIGWNLIEDNGASGFYLHDSANNNYIHHNVIQNNGGAGIFIWQESKNNMIYHNDFINNGWYNVKDKEGDNIWNYLHPFGGNYWDDYEGTDTNGDGIGETPYEIMGDFVPMGFDNYPWIEKHKWNDHAVIKSISGPSTGKPEEKYDFEFTVASENFGPGSDPFTEPAVCSVDWGDEDEEIIGPIYLDTTFTLDHTWSNKGVYTIKAKVTDGYGLESPVVTNEINIPRYRSSINNHIWIFLTRFINFLPILRIILNR